MDNSFQTSFIPKKPIIENGLAAGGKKNTTNISLVVTVSLMVIMGVAAVGLYFYKGYLQNNKNQLSANLSKVRESFDKDTISELEMYDKKTSIAREILDNHIVVSPIFNVINELTLSSIQYTRFIQERRTDDNFIVRMSGIAKDYKSIALQADVFNTGKGQIFKNLIFSNLTKDKNNYVTFDLEFTVDPTSLSYAENLDNSSDSKQIPTEITTQEVVPTTTEAAQEPLSTNNGNQ